MTVLPGRRHRRGITMAVVPVGRGCTGAVSRQEASMADKAAGPEDPRDTVSPGNKPGPPDQASAGGQAKSRDGAGRGGKAAAEGEAQLKFREALERKRAREAGNVGAGPGTDAGKIHGAHGPARSRRQFRRKSG
jgi:Family of unknown function (DUF5302)